MLHIARPFLLFAFTIGTSDALRYNYPVSFLSAPAPSGRMSVIKNLQSLDPSHRISDRDYMGWMDFGRRSAEEFEYTS